MLPIRPIGSHSLLAALKKLQAFRQKLQGFWQKLQAFLRKLQGLRQKPHGFSRTLQALRQRLHVSLKKLHAFSRTLHGSRKKLHGSRQSFQPTGKMVQPARQKHQRRALGCQARAGSGAGLRKTGQPRWRKRPSPVRRGDRPAAKGPGSQGCHARRFSKEARGMSMPAKKFSKKGPALDRITS